MVKHKRFVPYFIPLQVTSLVDHESLHLATPRALLLRLSTLYELYLDSSPGACATTGAMTRAVAACMELGTAENNIINYCNFARDRYTGNNYVYIVY